MGSDEYKGHQEGIKMKSKAATALAAFYIAILLWVNAMCLEKHLVIACFDLATAAIFIMAVLFGGGDNGRA